MLKRSKSAIRVVMANTPNFTLRLSDNARKALKALSANEERSMSQQIEYLVKAGFIDYAVKHPSFLEENKALFDSISSRRTA